MKINHWLFWSGLLVYVVAFALPAIFAPDSPALPGYRCAAFVTVMQPWSHENRALIHDVPFRYVPLMLTGWINPLFLFTTFLILIRKAATLVGFLKIVILLLIPFCWVVFHYETVRPREGHILWILGMLLALFSVRLRPPSLEKS